MHSDQIIHVIDDDEAVRDSLAFLLESADLTVATYETAMHFLERLGEIKTGCIVTDVRMPQMSGLDLVRELNMRGVNLPVIVMTGHADLPLAIEAIRAGVIDFIEKPFEDEVILAALRAALSRGQDQLELAADRGIILKRMSALSTREHQVLRGLVAGQANKVIALDLAISPRTVEVYRANLMVKMQAASLSELVRMALIAERSA